MNICVQSFAWMYGWLAGITGAMDMNLNKLCEIERDREPWHPAWGSQEVTHDWATEQQ